MNVNLNRVGAALLQLAALVYILGDYTEVEPLRAVGAILAVAFVALWIVLFAVAFVFAWRRNRIRKDVRARVDRLNEQGW